MDIGKIRGWLYHISLLPDIIPWWKINCTMGAADCEDGPPVVGCLGHLIFLDRHEDGWIPRIWWSLDEDAISCSESFSDIEKAIYESRQYIVSSLVCRQFTPVLEEWRKAGKISRQEEESLLDSCFHRP